MDIDTFLLLVATSAVIIVMPGPTVVAITSNGAGSGFRKSLFCVLGIICVTTIYIAMSATGIAALIIASHTLFSIIKWMGVAYLVYLGLATLFSKSGGFSVRPGGQAKPAGKLFMQSFLIEISNPKALLFYSAILPPFLDLAKPLAPQFLIMWLTVITTQCIVYSGYAYLGDHITRRGLKDWVVRLINKTTGGALLLAGLKMTAFSTTR